MAMRGPAEFGRSPHRRKTSARTDFGLPTIQTIQIHLLAIRRRYRRAAECWQAVFMTSTKPTRQGDPRPAGETPPASARKPLEPPRKAGPAPDQERYELAMEAIDHGLYDWDIEQGTIYYSPMMRA